MPEQKANSPPAAAFHAAHDRELADALLRAYRAGVFPMAQTRRDGSPGAIRWYSPDPRGVIPLEGAAQRLPRSLAQRVRSERFDIRADTDFEGVIRACAAPRAGEPGTWIDERIVCAYTALHRAGHAHSVEAWLPDGAATGAGRASAGPGASLSGPALVGGLYGVRIGGAFFGESMFCRPGLGGTDASKVCLAHLIHHLRRRGFVLLDTQWCTPHLERFGCVEVPRREYLRRLGDAVDRACAWSPFEPGALVRALRGPGTG